MDTAIGDNFMTLGTTTKLFVKSGIDMFRLAIVLQPQQKNISYPNNFAL